MDREQINKQIKELEYHINKQELRRTRNVMFMIIMMLVVLGGGLALGLLFGSLAKIMMLAVAIGVFANVGAIKEIGDANDEINRCNNQIKIYKKDLNKNNNITKNINKIEETNKAKNDYTYKQKNEKREQEIKIETFTEEDFYKDDNSKRR